VSVWVPVGRCTDRACWPLHGSVPSSRTYEHTPLSDRAIILEMTIHIGIMCEECGKVHFIGTSFRIVLSRKDKGMYQFTCKPPCPAVKDFRKDGMRPYRASDDVFERGYADVGEYELVQAG